jgi:ankyrin repeat protein
VAARHGRNDILSVLIKRGANVNVRIIRQETALITASKNGLVECVRQLLAVDGIEVDAFNLKHYTALIYADAIVFIRFLFSLHEITSTVLPSWSISPMKCLSHRSRVL